MSVFLLALVAPPWTLLLLAATPVALGLVGLWYNAWWITLGAVPASLCCGILGDALHQLTFDGGYDRDRFFFLACVLVCGVMVLMSTFIHGVVSLAQRQRIRPGHCRKCGYNLTGLPARRCPECGTFY